MTVRPIIKHPNPLLYTTSARITFGEPAGQPMSTDDFALLSDLHDTANFEGSTALGLAAVQIGVPKRMAVMRASAEVSFGVVINPEVIKSHESLLRQEEENCLSIPWLTVKIARPTGILAHYCDGYGNMVEKWLYGLEARVFQHELDHMDGITIETHRRRAAA
jgi:peptide deformylase